MAPRVLHKLNATRVRGVKARGRYEDGGGLRLVVSETGAKRWVLRVSVRGKRHHLGLGGYPTVSLERAREKAADIRRAASEGKNVLAERRAGIKAAMTFQNAFEIYFASKGPTLVSTKHRDDWRHSMQRYVHPVIGNRTVADVQPAEVLAVLQPIWFAKPDTAGRVLQRIDAVMNFAIANGWREKASPSIGARHVLGARRTPPRHYRFLPYQEVPGFVAQLRALPPTAARLCLQWAILTACRSGEARLAHWHEMNMEMADWTVPAERMKMRRLHTVPLSGRCLDLLREVRTMHPISNLVFPGTAGGTLSDMTLTKVLRSMGVANRATVHGFRSSFRTWCAEVAKVRPEVAEAALAHAVRDKVEAAYRRATYLDERRELMAEWAEWVNPTAT